MEYGRPGVKIVPGSFGIFHRKGAKGVMENVKIKLAGPEKALKFGTWRLENKGCCGFG